MLKKSLLVVIVLELNLSTKISLQLIAGERWAFFYLFKKFSNF